MKDKDVVEPTMTLRKAYETHGLFPAIGWYMVSEQCSRDEALRHVRAHVFRGELVTTKESTTYDDNLLAVAVNSSNDIVCVGHTSTKESDGTDALIIKFDANLNIVMCKRRCGRNLAYFDHAVLGESGSVLCIGYVKTDHVSENPQVVKFDNDLKMIWALSTEGGSDTD